MAQTSWIRIALVNLATNTVVAEQTTSNDGGFEDDVLDLARRAGQYEYGDRYERCEASESPVYALHEITHELALLGERVSVDAVRACPRVGYYRLIGGAR